MKPIILHLTLKKKWFDMIVSGEKREEYREIKPYWIKRLEGKHFDIIRAYNGYHKGRPTFDIECKGIRKGIPRPEWFYGVPELVFVIELGNIIK